MRHHAFVIEAEAEQGIEVAQAWVEKELKMDAHPSTSLRAGSNSDFVVMRYGLFSVEDARRVSELAASAPFSGESKALIIVASRAYHEAQNSLLKLFEEPSPGTYLFLVLPSLGGLLPTLRSRVQILSPYRDVRRPTPDVGRRTSNTSGIAQEFIGATKEKRTEMIKKIAAHTDGDAVSAREEALAIVNGIEDFAYRSLTSVENTRLLSDIATHIRKAS